MEHFKAENTYRSFPRSCVGMSPGTLRVPLLEGDAERHGMHSHAERGNDQVRNCGTGAASQPSGSKLPRHRLVSGRRWVAGLMVGLGLGIASKLAPTGGLWCVETLGAARRVLRY